MIEWDLETIRGVDVSRIIFAKSFSLNVCALVAKLVTRRVYAGMDVGFCKPRFNVFGIACVSDMF